MALPKFDTPALIDKYALMHFEKNYEGEDRKELLRLFHEGLCKCSEDERGSIENLCPYFYERIRNLQVAWEHNDEEVWEDVLDFQTECVFRHPPLETTDADVLINALCKHYDLTLVTTLSAGDGMTSRPDIAHVFGVDFFTLE